MGSWSVYCGISQISITSGKKCVLLPLKKTSSGSSYLPYMPATLPIFGEYDDYGGMENIEQTENTKFIEEYFECDIQSFCNYLTCGDDDMIPSKELKSMKSMFIDRQVYDFMSSTVGDEYDGKGHLDFGDECILKLLGFEYIGENNNGQVHDPKRFNQEWKFGDELFYSDGTWLQHSQSDNRGSIYFFNHKYNSLMDHITVPEDKMWIGDKTMWQLWSILDDSKKVEKLSYILDVPYSDYRFDHILSKYPDEVQKVLKENGYEEPKKSKSIAHKYIKNIDIFGDGLAELVTIRHNLHCMSGYFAPYVQYLTPQCGEFKQHQIFLDKFSEINKTYITNDED